jgi:hypothetical protein
MKLYALCAGVTVASTAAVVTSVFSDSHARTGFLDTASADSLAPWLIPLLAMALVAVFLGRGDEAIPRGR